MTDIIKLNPLSIGCHPLLVIEIIRGDRAVTYSYNKELNMSELLDKIEEMKGWFND